jgi:cytochrome c
MGDLTIRSIAAASVLALSLGLAACGDSDTEQAAAPATGEPAAPAADTGMAEPAETETAMTEPEPEPAPAPEPEPMEEDQPDVSEPAETVMEPAEDETEMADAGEPAPGGAAADTGAVTIEVAGYTGNAEEGAKVFRKCMACHVVQEGVNRVGPSLYGIIGRTAGTVPGYNYSPANKNSGVTWTPEVMFEYLENPRGFMPGTKMTFAGLPQPQDRADVIAYLKRESGQIGN